MAANGHCFTTPYEKKDPDTRANDALLHQEGICARGILRESLGEFARVARVRNSHFRPHAVLRDDGPCRFDDDRKGNLRWISSVNGVAKGLLLRHCDPK